MATDDPVKTVGRPRFGTPNEEDEQLKRDLEETARQARQHEGTDFRDFIPREGPKEIEKPAKLASEWTVKDLADQYQIPRGLVLEINGKPYVTKEGLLIQARRIGYDAIEADVRPIDGDPAKGWEAEGRITRRLRAEEIHLLEAMVGKDHAVFFNTYKDLRRPTIAHATASKENVANTRMHPYMKELAETRAINRALRLFTGCGLVSVDELPAAEEHA